MSTSSTPTRAETAKATIKAYEEKVKGQIQDGKARLEELEAKARATGAQAETAAINKAKTSKTSIDQKVQDLKKTHESNVARAKAEIDADLATFKSTVDDIGARLKNHSAKK